MGNRSEGAPRHDVVIIGGGPAGISALIWCHRLGLDALLVERRDRLGGQLEAIHNPIVDYPGLPAENGRALRDRLVAHVERLGCAYRCGVDVQACDVRAKRLATSAGELAARALIVATGARPRRLGVPGEAEMIARGEVYSATRDAHRFAGKRVAVVGGGDRALEGALLLAEAGARVTLIHRRDAYRARPEYLEPVLRHPNVTRLEHAVVTAILGEGRVEGVAVALHRPDGRVEARILEADAVFVRIGVEPNTDLVRGQVETNGDGTLRITAEGETSEPGVFAAGDVCTPPAFSSIALSVGQGMVAAKAIAQRLAKRDQSDGAS